MRPLLPLALLPLLACGASEATWSGDFARALWEDDKLRKDREAATPLRRIGAPRDIGGIAVFLASEAAAFVTGQVIVADGGVTIV